MKTKKQLFVVMTSCVLLFLSSVVKAQSVILSTPSSSSTQVDTVITLFSISEPVGTPQSIQVVFTPTSGPAAATGLPTSYVLTMKTPMPSPGSFTIKPSDPTNSANTYTASPSTPMPEGFYTAYCQYVRPSSAGGTTLKSTTRTNIYIDTSTQAPVLTVPATNGSSSSSVNVNYSLKEGYLTGSASLTFTGPVTNTLSLANNLLNANFNFSTTDVSASGFITGATSSTLPDGIYSVLLSYQDRFSHPVATALSSNFLIQTATPLPTITTPLASATLPQLMNFTVSLPSAPLAGSVTLNFTANSQTTTLVLRNIGSGTPVSFTLDANNLASSPYVVSASSNTLASGVYNVSLGYQDYLGNPVASAFVSGITLVNGTVPPTLSSPTNNQLVAKNGTFNLSFNLPETPLVNSVRATIGNCVLTLGSSTLGNQSIVIDPKNIGINSDILATTQTSIADGSYTVNISYRDALGNTVSTSTGVTLIIRTATPTPTLILPGFNSTNNGDLGLSFNLPEAALNNQVNIKLVGSAGIDIDLTTSGSGLQTYLLKGSHLSSTTNLVNSSKLYIPNDIYSLILSYKDVYGSDPAAAIQNNITVTGTVGNPVITTQTIALACDQTADLSTAITNDITGLTIGYFSDSALTNSISSAVSSIGTYYVKETNSTGLSSSASVVVNPSAIAPTNLGDIIGKSSVCLGENNVNYMVPLNPNATSYTWTLPAGVTGSSTTNSITVHFGSLAISGNISVQANNDCGSSTPSSIGVIVNGTPSTPTITQIDSVLFSSESCGNQWYDQNGIISGATNQYLIVTANSGYYVTVSPTSCFSATSNTTNVTLLGLSRNAQKSNKVMVYPNPITEDFTIEFSGNTEKSKFEVIDLKGQVFYKGTMVEKTIVPSVNLASGVYLIKIDNSLGTIVKEILKK